MTTFFIALVAQIFVCCPLFEFFSRCCLSRCYNQLQKYLRDCTVFWLKWPVHDLVLVSPPPPLFKVSSNTRPCSKLGGTTLNGGRRGVTILSHRPMTCSDLKQDRLFFRESVSTFLQLVVEKAFYIAKHVLFPPNGVTQVSPSPPPCWPCLYNGHQKKFRNILLRVGKFSNWFLIVTFYHVCVALEKYWLNNSVFLFKFELV